MGQENCKVSKVNRHAFLRNHGFEPLRGGDHITWINRELEKLAKKHLNIKAPANLRSGNAQSLWTVTVPDNPANGTWSNIAKYVAWCQKTVDELSGIPKVFNQVARPPAKAGKRKKQPGNNRNSTIHSPSRM
jgi:hypothetical protein